MVSNRTDKACPRGGGGGDPANRASLAEVIALLARQHQAITQQIAALIETDRSPVLSMVVRIALARKRLVRLNVKARDPRNSLANAA